MDPAPSGAGAGGTDYDMEEASQMQDVAMNLSMPSTTANPNRGVDEALNCFQRDADGNNSKGLLNWNKMQNAISGHRHAKSVSVPPRGPAQMQPTVPNQNQGIPQYPYPGLVVRPAQYFPGAQTIRQQLVVNSNSSATTGLNQIQMIDGVGGHLWVREREEQRQLPQRSIPGSQSQKVFHVYQEPQPHVHSGHQQYLQPSAYNYTVDSRIAPNSSSGIIPMSHQNSGGNPTFQQVSSPTTSPHSISTKKVEPTSVDYTAVQPVNYIQIRNAAVRAKQPHSLAHIQVPSTISFTGVPTASISAKNKNIHGSPNQILPRSELPTNNGEKIFSQGMNNAFSLLNRSSFGTTTPTPNVTCQTASPDSLPSFKASFSPQQSQFASASCQQSQSGREARTQGTQASQLPHDIMASTCESIVPRNPGGRLASKASPLLKGRSKGRGKIVTTVLQIVTPPQAVVSSSRQTVELDLDVRQPQPSIETVATNDFPPRFPLMSGNFPLTAKKGILPKEAEATEKDCSVKVNAALINQNESASPPIEAMEYVSIKQEMAEYPSATSEEAIGIGISPEGLIGSSSPEGAIGSSAEGVIGSSSPEGAMGSSEGVIGSSTEGVIGLTPRGRGRGRGRGRPSRGGQHQSVKTRKQRDASDGGKKTSRRSVSETTASTPTQFWGSRRYWLPSEEEKKALYGDSCFVIEKGSWKSSPSTTFIHQINKLESGAVLLREFKPLDMSGREFHIQGQKIQILDESKELYEKYSPIFVLTIKDSEKLKIVQYFRIDTITPYLMNIKKKYLPLLPAFKMLCDTIFKEVLLGEGFTRGRLGIDDEEQQWFDSAARAGYSAIVNEATERCKTITENTEIDSDFLKPFLTHPGLRFTKLSRREVSDGRKESRACDACSKRSKRGTNATNNCEFIKYGPYDVYSFENEVLPDNENTEKVLPVCDSCMSILSIISRLTHFRWLLYSTMRAYASQVVSELDRGSEYLERMSTVNALLGDYEWIVTNFLEYLGMLSQADEEIGKLKMIREGHITSIPDACNGLELTSL